MRDKEQQPGNPEEQQTEETATRSVKRGTLLILAVIMLSTAWYLVADRYTPYTTQARIQGYVVGVAPKVGGLVTDVWVDNNQTVEQDQKLFQIDSSQFEITLRKAQSDLENVRMQIDASEAAVEAAKAHLRAAQANELKAKQDAERQERLYKEDPGTISVRRLEIARATLAQASAKVTAREADVQKAIEQKGGEGENNAKLKAAQSSVDKAQLDLDNTVVRASTRGIITDLRTDVGQYAGAGNPVMTLISMHDIWINAEFTENNLGHLRVGTPVEIVLDVLPGEVFEGKVRSIGLGVAAGQPPPPGNLPTIQNNRDWLRQSQRYPVIIEFDPEQREDLKRYIRIGGQVDAMAYTEGRPFLAFLGRLYLRLMSILSYAY